MADGNFTTLTVTGTSDLGGDVRVGGNLAVGDAGVGLNRTLSVSGDIRGGAVSITGASMLQGATHLQSTLQVDGASTFAGDVGITGSLRVNDRDVAAIGTGLDQHVARTDNPHGTTAAQVGALPVTGGTVGGSLQVSGSMHVTKDLTVEGEIRGQLPVAAISVVVTSAIGQTVTLDTSAKNAVSVQITTSGRGSVILTASGKVEIKHVNGKQSLAWIGVPNGQSTNSTFVQIPQSSSSGTYFIPFSITRVAFVNSAGTHTFDVSVLKPSGFELGGGVEMRMLEPGLTALFIPS